MRRLDISGLDIRRLALSKVVTMYGSTTILQPTQVNGEMCPEKMYVFLRFTLF